MVPVGPLHPSLAVAGLVIGVSVAAIAGRSGGRWLGAVLGGATLLAGTTLDDPFRHGFLDRPDGVGVLLTTGAVCAVAFAVRLSRSTAVVVGLAGCAGVWAVVPDTEMPLAAGAVLFGAALLGALPGWVPDRRRRGNGLLVLLPLAGAAVGSVGRPSRYTPALVVGALVVLLGLALRELVRGLAARAQRAGTPMTVAPGATSSTTTAPAATTAP